MEGKRRRVRCAINIRTKEHQESTKGRGEKIRVSGVTGETNIKKSEWKKDETEKEA